MRIPPTPPNALNPYQNSDPKEKALNLIQQLLQILSSMIKAAKEGNADQIHNDRTTFQKIVKELKNLMETNKGAFSKSEMSLLEGPDGILFMEGNITNAYDNAFSKVGDYASELFGVATALKDEIQSQT